MIGSPKKYRKPQKYEFVGNDDKKELNDIANIDVPKISDREDRIGFKFVGGDKGLPITTKQNSTRIRPVNEEFSLGLGNGLNETVEYDNGQRLRKQTP